MANIGDVTARLRADVSDYVSGMQRATQANQTLQSTVNQSSQAFRLSEQGVNQAVAAYDRAMASTSGLRQGIDVLKADVAQATADFKAGLISIQDYRVALDQARQSALGLRTGGGLNGAEMSAVNSILVKTAPAAEQAVGGLSRVAMAMGMMASQATGAGFIVGRLAGALGLTVASAPVVVGVLAGVAGMIALWKQYSDVISKVDDDNKRAAEGLAKLAEQGMNPVVQRSVQAGQSVDAFATSVDKATTKARLLGTLGGILSQFGLPSGIVTGIPVSTTDANTAALAGFEGQRKIFTDGLGTTKQIMDQLTESETKARNAVADFGDSVEVAALKARNVSPEILREARAHQDNARALTVEREAMQINLDVANELAANRLTFNRELAAIPGFQLAPDEDRVTAAMRALADGLALSKEQMQELATATKDFNAEAAKSAHPGGVVSPLEASQLRGLGLDPNEIQQQLDKAAAPLDKATADLKDRFSLDMAKVGREGIQGLLQGIMDGTNSLLPLLQKILLEFLTAGISDVIGGFFNGSLGVAGGSGAVSSGGAVGIGAESGLRMSVHVGPSRDPMSLARDGQWQQALRESILVARSQGFKS